MPTAVETDHGGDVAASNDNGTVSNYIVNEEGDDGNDGDVQAVDGQRQTQEVGQQPPQYQRREKIVTGTLYERICQPIILFVSFGLNIPPFILAMLTVQKRCEYYAAWLIVNGIVCLINVGAVIFAIVKLRQKMNEDYISHEAHIELLLERQLRQRRSYQRSEPNGEQQRRQEEEEEEKLPHQPRSGSDDTTTIDESEGNALRTMTPQTLTSGTTTPASNNGTAVEQVLEEFEEKKHEEEEDVERNRMPPSQQQQQQQPHPTMFVPRSHPEYQRRLSGFQCRVISRRTQSSNRIRHLVCYNAQISTYAIVFIFWVFWLSSGAQLETRQFDESNEAKTENCEDYHRDYVTTSLTLGFSYVAVLVTSILLSFCDKK